VKHASATGPEGAEAFSAKFFVSWRVAILGVGRRTLNADRRLTGGDDQVLTDHHVTPVRFPSMTAGDRSASTRSVTQAPIRRVGTE
jgi:hypothetical protein